jgi:hypothetical protein
MKGDFTRQTFDPARHFSSVRLQQGRVQLDADFNEQADLVRHRAETEAADVIGGCGGPLGGAAFGIALDPAAPGDFLLTPGRYYVDGTLCEVEHEVRYTDQPDRPPVDPIDVAQAGFTVVYLDVWQRHETWLDDPLLRETALGGPDTATRTRTVWQVRTVFAGTAAVTCADQPAAYAAAIAPSTGRLAARARREDTSPDPCLIPAGAGYRGLENQLYRVEIHTGGEPYDLTAAPGDHAVTVTGPDTVVYAGGTWAVGQAVEIFRSAAGSDPMEGTLAIVAAHNAATDTLTLNAVLPDLGPGDAPRIRPIEATYKFSRDNGSVVTLVTSVAGREVGVASLGPDDVLGFAPGQWVELSDEPTELESRDGSLAQIAAVDRDARTVTLRTDPPAFAGPLPKLRRWDGVGAVKNNPPGTAEPFAELEDGVQVRFDDGSYRTGDHWTIPARTATAVERSGTIEWPADAAGEPLALAPAGIRHDFCKLAVVASNGSALTVSDCRSLFPPITELATLVYVGGDGQEARPGRALPQPLEAGVFRGRHPVAGARVRFTADAGGAVAADAPSLPGGAQTVFEATTGADGIAACAWRPANDLGRPSQRVEARLLNAGGAALAPQLDFGGQLAIAAEVAYVPGACADLADASTVQQALDTLCLRPSGEGCCRVVRPGTPIEEVVKELLERGERHVCLCLEGGEHKLDELELDGERLETLAISSCGEGARVLVGALELRGLAAVALRNLEILERSDRPILFDACGEVTIEDCRIARVEAPGPVALIGRADRLRISGCVLDAGAAPDESHPREFLDGLVDVRDRREYALKSRELAERLARSPAAERKDLAGRIARAQRIRRLTPAEQESYQLLSAVLSDDAVDPDTLHAALGRVKDAARLAAPQLALALLDGRAEALIEATEIAGALVLYGPTAGTRPNADILALARQAQQTARLTLRPLGSLHLRDVRVTGLALGEKVISELESLPAGGAVALPVFRGLHISDCEVMRGDSALMAADATLTADDFLDGTQDVGALIANTAIVTGARAPNDVRLFVVANRLAVAANLVINVVQL